MKFIGFFISLFLGTWVCFAQNNTHLLREKLDDVFSQINKSQIPTGILEEYGYGFVDLKDVTPDKVIDANSWRMIYATLFTARIHGTQTLPPLSVTNLQIQNSMNTTNSPIILHYEYSVINPAAIWLNHFQVVNDRLQEVAVSSNTYWRNNVFAFFIPNATNLSSTTGTRFIFKPEYFYTNTAKTLQKIEFDADDGQGFKIVQWNHMRLQIWKGSEG